MWDTYLPNFVLSKKFAVLSVGARFITFATLDTKIFCTQTNITFWTLPWWPPFFAYYVPSCGHIVRDTIAGLGLFLSKNCMHVKTVQIEFFAIEIVNSSHIWSFKKVLPKCEKPDFTYWKGPHWKSVFRDIFYSLQGVPSRYPWTFFMRTWSKSYLIIENWFWVQLCAKAKM